MAENGMGDDNSNSDTRKRPFESENGDGATNKRQAVEISETDDVTTLHLLIPSTMVGALIGKGGSQIKQYNTDSGSKITIAQDPADAGGMKGMRAPERVVTITGNLLTNTSAQRMISDRIDEQQRSATPVQPGSAPADPSAVVLKMLIPAGAVGVIIGRAGSTIKSMIEESGSRINVGAGQGGSDQWRLVTITGTLENNSKAQHLLSRRVVEREKTSPPAPRVVPTYGAPPPHMHQMQHPVRMAPPPAPVYASPQYSYTPDAYASSGYPTLPGMMPPQQQPQQQAYGGGYGIPPPRY